MSDILNKTIVLVLNRNWQAINIRTPAADPHGASLQIFVQCDFATGEETVTIHVQYAIRLAHAR